MSDFHLISKYAICYCIYFLLLFVGKTERSNRLLNEQGPVHNPGILLGLQLAGILWLGIVPFFILQHSTTDIVFGQEIPSILQMCCLLLLLIASVTIAILHTAKKGTGGHTAQPFQFSNTFIRRYTIYRTIFLLAYELFFRGYLLSDSTQSAGILVSIVINTALYALLHIFSDKKEIIACIPFGIILCGICLWFGAAWPAMLIHAVFAMTYELRLVKKNFSTINNTQYENICNRLFRLHRE